MPSILTTTLALGSLIVPLNAGVVSFVITFSTVTAGADVSMIIVPVSMSIFPAGSVAVTVAV